MDSSALHDFADELEASLLNDLIDRWYPLCVDLKGGFRQSFDRRFSLGDDTTKFVVFQSRVTWAAVVISEAFPDRRETFAAYARHGLRFLLDCMLDQGSFQWWLDKDGKPTGHADDVEGSDELRIPNDTRRVYGIAFGLYALSAAARSLHDAEALSAAKGVFAWLEEHCHDPLYGGYVELTQPDGSPFPRRPLPSTTKDFTNNPFGLKSHNTQLHMLEALAELCRAWPDAMVRARLAEMVKILAGDFITNDGCSVSALNADLSKASDRCSYGHDIEAAHLLLDAGDLVGIDIRDVARGLGDHSLAHGLDSEFGGMLFGGIAGGEPKLTQKDWWVHAEALLGYATLYSIEPSDTRYLEAARHNWTAIREHHIDHEFGGWFGSFDRQWNLRDGGMKGYAWKALYHETRALLYTARVLRSLAGHSR